MKAGKKGRMVALAAVIAVASALLIHAWLHPAKPPSFPPLPNPNGYDDFVAAGGMFTSAPDRWDDLDTDKLRAVVTTDNSNAFERIHLGLSRQCRIPTKEEITNSDVHANVGCFKSISFALANKGRLAEIDRHPADAANDYVMLFAVASKSGHGGFVIQSLVQVAMEADGAKCIRGVIASLSAPQSRECLTALQKAEADRESFAQIEANEALLQQYRAQYPFRESLWDSFLRFLGKSPDQAITSKSRLQYAASELKILTLETQLASHAFQLERGRAAASWSDLVPEYLPAIPANPTNHQPLAFPP